ESHRDDPAGLRIRVLGNRLEFQRLGSLARSAENDANGADLTLREREDDIAGKQSLSVFLRLAASFAFVGLVCKPQVRAIDFGAERVRMIDPPEACAHASIPPDS